MFNDSGLFTYESDGFIFRFKDGPQKILWSQIDRITAYKADLSTYDEIRLNIEFGGSAFIFTEDTPGFFQFVLKTKKVFPSIPEDWDTKIINPPFAANEMVIYERMPGGMANGGLSG
jgi:hypothetical protein